MEKIAAKIVEIKLQLQANTDVETYEIVSELLYDIYKIASDGKETTDEYSNCIKPAVSGSAYKSDETIHYEALKDCCNNLLDEVAKGNTPRRQLTGLKLLLNRK